MAQIPNPRIPEALIDRNFFANQDGKEIYNLVKSGQAFRNPLAGRLAVTNAWINTFTLNQFDRWINLQDTPPPGFLPLDLLTIRTSIQENFLDGAFANFTEHTNLISGVTNNPSTELPDFRKIMSVGSASVALDNALNEAVGNPCGQLLTAFGSLFLGEDAMNDILGFYQSIIGLMNNGEATANQILGRIEEQVNLLEGLIGKDRDHFNLLVNDLLFASLSQTLPSFYQTPCGRYLLEQTVGRAGLLKYLF